MTFCKSVLIVCLLFFFQNGYAQNLKFGERLIIGTSMTYIPNYTEGFFIARYDEWTWDKNIAVNLNKSLYLGLSFKNIYTRGSAFIEGSNYRANAFLVGPFIQYDFLPKMKERLFLEASWGLSNYYASGRDLYLDPYIKEDLHNIGVGIGGSIPINDYLSLDLAFNNTSIIEEGEFVPGPNFYVVGLDLDIIFKRK